MKACVGEGSAKERASRPMMPMWSNLICLDRMCLPIQLPSREWANITYWLQAFSSLEGDDGCFGQLTEVAGDRAGVIAKGGELGLESGYFRVSGAYLESFGEGG